MVVRIIKCEMYVRYIKDVKNTSSYRMKLIDVKGKDKIGYCNKIEVMNIVNN